MGRFPWPNWWNRDEEVRRQEPIVWVDEPANVRPPAPPAPPPRRDTVDPAKQKQMADLLVAVRILSRDTMDFLLYNDCGHTEQGLWQRHEALIEEIERVTNS